MECSQKFVPFFGNLSCKTRPFKGYGLSETAATAVSETKAAHRIGSVGIPLALCNMKIVEPETGEELTYNIPGEVCLSGPSIMQGYYQNQNATYDVIEIIDGVRWLHTGDIGVISEDGLLTINGRIKRIIVCKEGSIYHKVFPQLLEDQLAKVPGVYEISIVGRPDEAVGNRLIAYVVTEKSQDFDCVQIALRDYCSSHLEPYETPAEYVCMEKLPRTLIGKVDFRALEEMAKQI